MPAKTYKSEYTPDTCWLTAEWVPCTETIVITVRGSTTRVGISLNRKAARKLAKQIRKETKRGEA